MSASEQRARAYASGGKFSAPQGYGVSLEPVEGYYRTKLVSGGLFVGIFIWYGPPFDPVSGEEMDRSHRWQAHCNGQYIDIDRVWPGCGGDPIDRAEYCHLTSLQDWGREHAPKSPQANPFKPVDLLTAPMPF